eukprot:TRINITY_DN3442_c0_g3_i1.p1 TRINITY_DN3442_c0_g3~~TRINITY_DN3442_c0_g3_i1.p1  ORF type:complete len:742 (+),score=238.23 TRINITY_DN3442_c0_g3_i1:265-2226(+)
MARGGGNDFMDGLKDGPWTVQVYDVVARTSGRYIIAASNALLITMMHTTFNRLSEVEGCVINFDGWHEANMRIHSILGWGMGVLVVPHVWSPFFVVWSHGYSVESVWPDDPRSELVSPVSEMKHNCSEVDIELERICLNSDDYGRLIGMTLMFCALFPMTRLAYFLKANWSLCAWAHALLAVGFVFDNLRRRSHPHSWVLNLPVTLLYLLDVLAGWLYRSPTCRVVGRLRLDDTYSVVYWKAPAYAPPLVGDLYYLRARVGAAGTSRYERPHPFTCFANRTGSGVPARVTADPAWRGHALVEGCAGGGVAGDGTTDVDWDVAALVKAYPAGKRSCCGCVAQTPLLVADGEAVLEAAGPYRSPYAALSEYESLPAHTTLISSGSGGSFIIDFADAVARWEAEKKAGVGVSDAKEKNVEETKEKKKKKVAIVYTTRSVPLLQFVTDRLGESTLIDLEVSHVALTAEGVEFFPDAPDPEQPPEAADVDLLANLTVPLGKPPPAHHPLRKASQSWLTDGAAEPLIAASFALDVDRSSPAFANEPLGVASLPAEGQWMSLASKPVEWPKMPVPSFRDSPMRSSPSPSAYSVLSFGDNRRRSVVETLRTQRLALPEILEEHTPPGGDVFFCGSAGLLKVVQRSCRKAGLRLHETHAFSG